MNPNVLLGVNLRDFEVTMSGGFLITQFNKELPYFFKDGLEVVTFKNEYELVDKIKYYLKNESERKQISEGGYRRALMQHTWKNRFEKLFDYVKSYIK